MAYKKTVEDKDYFPNHVPLKNRVTSLIFIFLLLGYGAHGLYKGELFLAYRSSEVTLFGNALVIALISFLMGCAYFTLTILDHYDKRNNEHIYRRLEAIFKGFSALIFVVALVVNYAYTVET
ncbi:hypothetical protein [uncultured Paraglaciecola sp.]|uniref:hypothetical protein n=1 Tax=uncultured Paraglaciecola sp. TaxID=1765024 RepID=UPI002599ABD0|nr:hypothetical protein [uncultured Paraglaciecola sp.]